MAYTALVIKDANAASQSMGAFQDAASINYPAQTGDVQIAHYRAAFTRLTPVATPTVVWQLIGSASKTVRVKRIGLSGGATSAGEMPFTIDICSAAGTLSTAVQTAVTAVPMDSTAAAATAVCNTIGTANYGTVPTLVGHIVASELEQGALTTGVFVENIYEFGQGGRQAIVLRGVAQQVNVNFNGTALPSGTKLNGWIEWQEDAS